MWNLDGDWLNFTVGYDPKESVDIASTEPWRFLKHAMAGLKT